MIMLKKFFTLLVIPMSISFIGIAQQKKATEKNNDILQPVETKDGANLILFRPGALDRKDAGRNLVLDQATLSYVWDKEPAQFTTTIPLPNFTSVTYTFVRNQVLSDDFYVETSDGRKLKGKEYEGIHYKLEGDLIGGLSFREDGVLGMISHAEGGAFNIGESTPGKGNYVIVDDRDQGIPTWTCQTDDHQTIQEMSQTPSPKAAASCKKVQVYFEADNDLYKKSNSNVTTASTFITGFFNIVAQLYLNEQINIEISSIYVWTTADPYTTQTQPGNFLLSFANNRPVASVNGNIAHMVSTRNPNMGGIAYTGVLCSSQTVHGLSNIYYSYSALPTYSWTVGCVTHEIGHNFGSKHTHWCGWALPSGQTGRIDSCYASEAYNGSSCGTVTKARTGTIMSYCHITMGGINFNLGFGPLPGNAIRNGLANASCISGTSCLGTASVKVDSTTNKDKNYILTISIPANHNAKSWKLMEGSTLSQSGNLTGTAAQTIKVSISGKENAIYSYTVQLVSSTGATTTSANLPVTVAVPVALIIIPSQDGNCVISNLMAWFDANGKMNFKFDVNPTCTTYTVSLCRYNMTNPAVIPTGNATPTACSVRNGMTSYKPTSTEMSTALIERVANPQPGNMTNSPAGSYWYSVDVICNSKNCSTPSRTRTYIFVPGI